ncbi:MAG TPA: protein-methionine-sulfoxide reductase catalytic subunit MsrP [Vicinamibacterales bacterium]|nr:protein-methionine-sulfoxide reductase catalytic subunit MsrP [Vicinamibacterales bacterium]
MIVKSKKPWDLPHSEVTPEGAYRSRREFLRAAGIAGVGAAAGGFLLTDRTPVAAAQAALQFTKNPKLSTSEPQNSYEQITSYNNFYEFGTGKGDPAMNAHALKVKPWTVRIDGHVAKPADYALEDVLKPHPLEERVYRFRCVEAWSAVIPWIGFPLAALLKRVQPTSQAKYVAFTTLLRPAEMRGQRSGALEWPYVEGLRLDEAMNELTLMTVGLYGKELPNQNGAPLRLIVPWKYGFKSIKSIVKISLVDKEPPTSWNIANPSEYGFYSNVNPEVDHPRWSQKRERPLGALLQNKPTVKFNGYGDQVASLYAGMDLRKYY